MCNALCVVLYIFDSQPASGVASTASTQWSDRQTLMPNARGRMEQMHIYSDCSYEGQAGVSIPNHQVRRCTCTVMKLSGWWPTRLAMKKVGKGTPTMGDARLMNQPGSSGVARRNSM